MATIEKPDPYFSPGAATRGTTGGWSAFDNEPVSFPSETRNAAPASRSAPTAMTGAEHLHPVQFTPQKMSMHPGGGRGFEPKTPSGAYSHLSTSNMHPGGGAFSSVKPNPMAGATMSDRVKAANNISSSQNNKKGFGSRLVSKLKLGGTKSAAGSVAPKGRGRRGNSLKPSKHAGKNAANLSAATGK